MIGTSKLHVPDSSLIVHRTSKNKRTSNAKMRISIHLGIFISPKKQNYKFSTSQAHGGIHSRMSALRSRPGYSQTKLRALWDDRGHSWCELLESVVRANFPMACSSVFIDPDWRDIGSWFLKPGSVSDQGVHVICMKVIDRCDRNLEMLLDIHPFLLAWTKIRPGKRFVSFLCFTALRTGKVNSAGQKSTINGTRNLTGQRINSAKIRQICK